MRDWQGSSPPLHPPTAVVTLAAEGHERMERQDGIRVSVRKQRAWLTKALGAEQQRWGQPASCRHCLLSWHSGQGAECTVMVRRARADFCVLDEAGGLESHAFIYLTVKQLFLPTLVWRIMGHYALRAIKGLHLHHAEPGMKLRKPRIQLRKSQQQLLRWCLQGTDLGRHRTEMAHVLWAPPKARAGKLKPAAASLHSRDAVPGSVSIREHLLCVPTLLWATKCLHFPTGSVFPSQST